MKKVLQIPLVELHNQQNAVIKIEEIPDINHLAKVLEVLDNTRAEMKQYYACWVGINSH
jgi:O-acetylhomoserine/O-acetylserine sulfhydrylase-like pyridoxal-dependent enzyme